MTSLLAVPAVGLYLLAATLMMRRFLQPRQGVNQSLPLIIAGVGALAHIGFLANAIVIAPGQNMSITNVLSLVSWLITCAMLLSASVLPNLMLLPVVFTFSALTILASWLIPVAHIMHIELHPGLVVHITLSLFAYGTLVIAFLYALQMSYITYRLKQKGSALLHSALPPLMMVEGMMFRLLQLGTGLLIIAQLSGFVFLENMFSRMYAHKTVLSLMALGLYLFILAGEKLRGWQARQVIVLNIIGVVLLSLAYFGSRFVREVLL